MKGPPSSPRAPIVSVEMVDEDVVARVATLIISSYGRIKPRKSKHSTTFRAQVRGCRAVRLMQALRPLMGRRRQAQIDRALSCAGPGAKRIGWPVDEELLQMASSMVQKEIAKKLGCCREAVNKRLAKIRCT